MKHYKVSLLFLFVLIRISGLGQGYSEILGRPTDSAVTMNVMFDRDIDIYWELGTASGLYTRSTPTYAVLDSIPLEVDFTGLTTNTKYYYRIRYRQTNSGAAFTSGPEHVFRTRRPRGSSYSFAITADPHLDTNCIESSYLLTLQNILSKNVDFMIDLGDNFLSEKYIAAPGSQTLIPHYQDTIRYRTVLFRKYYGMLCHSAPLFLTIGNHEGELGWKLTGTDTSMPVVACNIRKQYYANPYPNGFYSGNDSAEAYVGFREDYYAWEWGDALFMVIDPYWFTRLQQHAGWGWTLGSRQFAWFRNTIRNSTAKYKFVFSHQLVGGNTATSDGRGGAEFVGFFEQGGRSADSTWDFDSARLHWEQPIHSLMMENKGRIFFHGHDHFYGKQDKDGVVYQEVPQPSAKNIKPFNSSSYPYTTQYGYSSGTILPNRGFLLVTVNSDSVKVEYVKTYLPSEETSSQHNMDVAHSYVLKDTLMSSTATYTFIGDGNWDVSSNWLNNLMPPSVLPAGASILVNPVYGGKCYLNATQIISTGASLQVQPGKQFLVPGSLIMH
jgi:hypothetical protein